MAENINSFSSNNSTPKNEIPEGAIQYHDLDLDILNLENTKGKTSGTPDTDVERISSGSGASDKVKSVLSEEIIETREEETEEPKEYSKEGILDEATVDIGLCNLGTTADGVSYAYLDIKIAGYRLVDISMLQAYTCLQMIDLSYNRLEDLSILGHLRHLVHLNVSHNQLSQVLAFEPRPYNLKTADFSFNQITVLPDLSAHHYLASLNLDNNQITKIQGVSQCIRLSSLSLSHNRLTKIEGLDGLSLRFLDLSYNEIPKIEGLASLARLQKISLSGNSIRCLRGLEGHEALESILLDENAVVDVAELQYLSDLRVLRQLSLQHNPVQEVADYRLQVIFELKHLTELDGHRVDVDEKVHALNQFDPPMSVIAQRDHRLCTVYEFFQPHTIRDSTLQSSDTPYPMLVLAGPQGSGKKELAMKLVQDFQEFFGFAVSHTTRRPRSGEENGRDFHFVTQEEFENLHLKGKFLQTAYIQGQWYGLTQDAIESVARDGLACVVVMEIEGVLSLKLTSLEPRYVLTMPLSRLAQEQHMRDRLGVYTESEIGSALARAAPYLETNRKQPGFFDMFINTDDLPRAYYRLRRLVMDYLGLTSMEEGAGSAEDSDALKDAESSRPRPTGTERSTGNARGIFSRTWSKNSLPLSASQKNRRSSKTTPSAKGIVEEESLQRRQSAAKEVVVGTRTNPLDSLPRRTAGSAPLNADRDALGSESSGSRGGSNMSRLSGATPELGYTQNRHVSSNARLDLNSSSHSSGLPAPRPTSDTAKRIRPSPPMIAGR